MTSREPMNSSSTEMYVIKRNGKSEIMKFDKIQNRIKKSGEEAGISKLNYTSLTIKIIDQLYDKIPTTQIDELSAQQCYSMTSVHPDYALLASRIIHSNHQRSTSESFYYVMTQLYKFMDKQGNPAPMLSDQVYGIIRKYRKELEAMIIHDRDYLIDYFGFKTLERAYLMRINKKVVERIQHMWLRVSIGIHGDDMDRVRETYDAMSQKWFIHATPTLFNAGTPRPQLSSCFLLAMESDSIDGIFNTLQDCANISKWGGGIGLHAHNIRAKGSHIRGTNGQSNGLVPMLRVFNNTAKYVDQCFTPDSVVFTEAGPKAIEDVGTTDRVLTSSGEFHAVLKPVRHEYEGPMLEIACSDSNPVSMTPEHQIMALQGVHDQDMDVIKNRMIKGDLKPEFHDAKDLSVGDFLVFSRPSYEKDIEHLSAEDCRFYGILVGSGHITPYDVSISLLNKEVVEFVQEYCSIRGIQVSNKKIGTSLDWDQIVFSVANPSFKFTKSQLYDIRGQKRIDPSFLHLPVGKVEQVLRGILETGSNVSKISDIEDSIRYMKLRLCMYDPKSSFLHENHIYSIIEEIREVEYKGIVHDFEIDGPHDYTMAHLGVVHNGGGKRNGSFAIYLEPWHADVQAFLQMKKNHGDEEQKGRDLFYALWIPDLFMERMHKDEMWTLMCPDECPGLSDVWGSEFVALYEKYESEGKGKEVIKARDLWIQILDAQMETGTPYLLYKDACNRKSNQQNVGTIKSSNLCVAPETKILTDQGHIEIRELHGQQVNVWNGEEFSQVTIHKTGENKELMEVETSDGCVLSCTPYHKFYIQNDRLKESQLIEAQHLKQGDCLISCKFPVIRDNKSEKVYELDQVPINDSLEKKLSWFRNYTKNMYPGEKYDEGLDVYATDSKQNTFLMDMKLMLQTCGINPTLTKMNNDTLHKMSISLNDLKNIGLCNDPTAVHMNDLPIRIKETRRIGRIDDTYCFNESKRHAGIFNGIITSQCTEIIEYSDENESAVCNLASISLPAFIKTNENDTKSYDFESLHKVSKTVAYNLNRVIDASYYPTEKTERSNKRHRPIGIGVQGLADVFMQLRMPFDSPAAKELNKLIFETIYHAALEQSCELAKKHGPYETFAGSPAHRGELQFDLWSKSPTEGRYDWISLKEDIKEYGLRNSLLIAPMPTASTSQILGNNECFEPITSNIYSRGTNAGQFLLANKYLQRDLIELGVWNEQMKNRMVANNGSIQALTEVPEDVRALYKTVWEIPQRVLIDMAVDRGAYICQSQSLNLWLEDPNYKTLTTMHYYSWKQGLKTGIYYLRRRARHQAQKFTIEPTAPIKKEAEDVCEMCSA